MNSEIIQDKSLGGGNTNSRQKGILTLSNPTSNVSFSVVGEPVPKGYTINFSYNTRRGGQVWYRINNGPDTQATSSTPSTFNNVEKLEIQLLGQDVHYVEIDGTEYYETSYLGWTDYTQYLREGSSVYAYADDYWYMLN